MLTTAKKRIELGNHKELPAVTVAATSTLVLAANPSRKTAILQASSANTETLFFAIGRDKTAVVDFGIAIDPGGIYVIGPDDWTGEAIYMVCASGGMTCFVSESE